MVKLVFQRAYLRRDVQQYPMPVFIFGDEMQRFLLPKGLDNAFHQVCRSMRVAVCYVTQNLSQVAEEYSEHEPGSRTKAFLGNLMLKIFHQQNDTDTNEYAANLIGKEYRHLKSSNISHGGGMTSGKHEQLLYKLEPDTFTQLPKPGPSNPVSTAIVYQGGKTFCDAHNYLAVNFTR